MVSSLKNHLSYGDCRILCCPASERVMCMDSTIAQIAPTHATYQGKVNGGKRSL